MAIKSLNTKVLDEILEKMISTVDKSKDEIFQIGEQCRVDYESIINELKKIKEKVASVIDEEERLDKEVRQARKRLSEVSMYFHKYNEEQVRAAYEIAHSLQTKLTVTRQLEKQLRERRDELERRLVGLQETIDRADHLVTQVNVILNYLTNDIKQISEYIADAKEKQEFGLKIIEAQEEERKRLSREIHDGPAQMLAHVMMRSDLVEKMYRERGVEEALQEIRTLKQTVRDALYEVRRVIYDLRPMALDDLGLVPTLKKYLQTVEEYNKSVYINFIYIGEDKRVPPKMEIALFRLVQESVQNALKHANATNIEVKLEINCKVVIALIKDNGCGFDITEKKEGTFGLRGMKERVELLSGSFHIKSSIGKGTTILIQIPITE
ncbi:sensor histidine kinase [Bacillus kwashiorkori]|uniref:sensor histidine kinase n=1 Tax=Bacillus kwashiorkori TaxID=1522318 RepID=UPI00078133D1|nr:sensor histidine kinase [Bacillus kwashiorkori]